MDDVIRRQWRRREGGHIRWDTPQDKDSHTFLVGQFSEVNVLSGIIFNNCGSLLFGTGLRRHPCLLESTKTVEQRCGCGDFEITELQFPNRTSWSYSLNSFGILESFGGTLDSSIASKRLSLIVTFQYEVRIHIVLAYDPLRTDMSDEPIESSIPKNKPSRRTVQLFLSFMFVYTGFVIPTALLFVYSLRTFGSQTIERCSRQYFVGNRSIRHWYLEHVIASKS